MSPPHTFGPRVAEVDRFLTLAEVEGSTVDLLEEINRRRPDLSFREFWGTKLIATAVAWEPGDYA
jgi:hypothetical protein